MALNNRGVMDPRFPFFARPVATGAMLCRGTLYRVTADANQTWDPFNADPSRRTPTDVVTLIPIYIGAARVQPGQDWRARQQNARSETTVENMVRVQLDFAGNTITGGVPNGGPIVRVDDVFRVDEVHQLGGVPVDRQLLTNVLIVRNVNTSSNQWARNLSCALDVTRIIENGQLVSV